MKRLLATTVFLIFCNAAYSEVVVIGNPSFEVGNYPIITRGWTIPGPEWANDDGLKGGWGQNDGTQFVTAENGINPYHGSQMLKFVTTGYPGDDFTSPDWVPRGGGGESSDIVQLIDLSGFSSRGRGSAVLTASVRVNRIAASEHDLYKLSLWSFSGPFDELTNVANTPDRDELTYAEIHSDSDETTWEALTLNIRLPVDTSFVRLGLSALDETTENSYPELSGHYADLVSADITLVEY
ncbi:MAG: hypothetical protein GY732_17000 [Gammaproteobacteria bacterium]|nr:hypothetical protein [Gammaproteobacteria bacterium]